VPTFWNSRVLPCLFGLAPANQHDVLEFGNPSDQFMRLVFVKPQDQTDKIRCYPIDHTIA
jgi:hypothetical protein